MPHDSEEQDASAFATVSEDTELVCWLNPERICGIDCTAYDMRSADNENFYPCSLINVGRSIAAAMIRLSKMVQDKPERVNIDPKAKLNDMKPPPIG